MRKFKFISIILSLFVLLSGCYYKYEDLPHGKELGSCLQTPLKQCIVREVDTKYFGTSHVLNKNYEVGQKQIVYVGQPIVKVQDYHIEEYESDYMVATSSFHLIYPLGGKTVVSKGEKYKVRGKVTIDNENYTAVLMGVGLTDIHGRIIKPEHQDDVYQFLVKENGELLNNIMVNNVLSLWEYDFDPPRPPIFEAEKVQKILTKKDYYNYELVYGGTDGKSIAIDYREFTSDDLASPAFYQDLFFEMGKENIRYNNTVLQIHEVTNEKIVYTILSDGY